MHSVLLQRTALDGKDVAEAELPVMALLVKLFFDARTTTCHRATIAVLFRTIFATKLSQIVKELQRLISVEYNSKRPMVVSKKRKRLNKDAIIVHRRDRQGWHRFSLEDLQVLGSILSHMPVAMIANLPHDVERFCLETISFTAESNRSQQRLSDSSMKNAIFCFTFLEATVREDPVQNTLNSPLGGANMLIGIV
jgi:hypothetical protein